MGIRYHLPETRVRLSGLIDHVTTSFDPSASETVSSPASATIEWVVAADGHAGDVLSLDGATLEDRLTTIAVTPDRRLASATSNATGHGATAVKALAQAVGVAVAGAVGAMMTGTDRPVSKAKAAYDFANPRESKRLARLRAQLADGRDRLDSARDAYLAASSADRPGLHRDLVQLGRTVEAIERDLDEAVDAFRAWVAARTTTRVETVQTLLELRQLPRWDGHQIDWTSAAPAPSGIPDARTVWDRLGFVVARTGPVRQPTLAGPDGPGILVRIPRLEAFALLRPGPSSAGAGVVDGGGSGEADSAGVVVEETFQHWVLDDRCDTEFITFDKSLFGSRELTVGFDADGALTSIAKTTKDGAVPAITAVTSGALDALATAKTVAETTSALAGHREAVRLARITTELAVAKAEADLVGLAELATTRAERARLAHLQQLAEGADPAG